jgi:hypothetical protein
VRVALLSVAAAAPATLEQLANFAERVGPTTFAPVAAELVPSLRAQPRLAALLGEAFAAGKLSPLYACAHGSDARLLDAAELADELRLADEVLRSLGAEPTEKRGFVGQGDADALEQASIDFVLGKVGIPTRIGERLIALPYENEHAVIVRVDGDDAAALAKAMARVEALVKGGAELVPVGRLADKLTPPWMERTISHSQAASPAARSIVRACRWLCAAFGLHRAPQVAAAALCDEGWRLDRLPSRARLPLSLRRVTAANRRALVAAFELCDVISVEARVPGLAPHAPDDDLGDTLDWLRAFGDEHGAGEPFARAASAYHELRDFRFLGGARWRALASSLRDGFALLSMQSDVDWDLEVEAHRGDAIPVEHVAPLSLVEPASLN